MPEVTSIDESIAIARRWVGSTEPPTDDDLYDKIYDLGTAELAALYILEVRYSDFLADSTSFSVTGFSESHSPEKLKLLRSQIEELRIITDTQIASVGTVETYRSDRYGR